MINTPKNKKLIVTFKDYFKGRTDVFAEQYKEGYKPVKSIFSDLHIEKHLSGDNTYGIYPIIPEKNICQHTIIDIDVEDTEILDKLINSIYKIGISEKQILLEFSGKKGFHIWLKYSEMIPAWKTKLIGKIILKISELSDKNIEIFPKQARVDQSKYGNLIKLPLGLHKISKERSYFLDSYYKKINNPLKHLISRISISLDQVEEILHNNKEDSKESTDLLSTEFDYKFPKHFPPCISKILEQGVSEGNRNDAAFVLSVYLKNIHLPHWIVKVILNDWNDRNNQPMGTDELNATIDSAYKGDYRFKPCEKDILKDFCDPKVCTYSDYKDKNTFHPPEKIGAFLNKDFPQIESYLGKGILVPKSILVISGKGKIGKSIFAQNLAICLASKTQFLCFPVHKKLRVLYLQAEISETSLQKRFQDMMKKNIFDENLLVNTVKGFDINNELMFQELSKWIKDFSIDVLIIDPLYKFHNSEENSSKEIKQVLDQFDVLIQKFQISIIIVHHHKKPAKGESSSSNQLRGSSVLFDFGDSYIRLNEFNGDKKILKIEFDLRNAEEPEPFHIARNETLWFQTKDEKIERLQLLFQVIRKSPNKRLTQKEILDIASQKINLSESTIRNCLRDGEKQGLLISKKEGKNRFWEYKCKMQDAELHFDGVASSQYIDTEGYINNAEDDDANEDCTF